MNVCVDFFFQQTRCTEHGEAGHLGAQGFTGLGGHQGDIRFRGFHLFVPFRGSVFLCLVQDLAMALIGLLDNFSRFGTCLLDFLAGLCFRIFFNIWLSQK